MGHSTITYDIADEMLKQIRELWEAQSEGAFGYFKGMAEADGKGDIRGMRGLAIPDLVV